jgi:hypothetical protein
VKAMPECVPTATDQTQSFDAMLNASVYMTYDNIRKLYRISQLHDIGSCGCRAANQLSSPLKMEISPHHVAKPQAGDWLCSIIGGASLFLLRPYTASSSQKAPGSTDDEIMMKLVARVEAKRKLDGVVDKIEYKPKVEQMRADTTYTTQRSWRYFSIQIPLA